MSSLVDMDDLLSACGVYLVGLRRGGAVGLDGPFDDEAGARRSLIKHSEEYRFPRILEWRIVTVQSAPADDELD